MAKKLLLLLLLIILSLHACSGSIVNFLPGFEGPLPFELETGYIGVGEEEQGQLFYYFVKSEKNPKEDPLLLWLTGGPGCSSLSALFFENGPVTFNEGSRPALLSTTHSWTKVANIIFLDQPIGTGFSYATTELLDTPSDSGQAKQIQEFIRKWLSKHTEFISNPFYVAGNSYSGKTIPATVQEISKGNDLGFKPQVNLKDTITIPKASEGPMTRSKQRRLNQGFALAVQAILDSLAEPPPKILADPPKRGHINTTSDDLSNAFAQLNITQGKPAYMNGADSNVYLAGTEVEEEPLLQETNKIEAEDNEEKSEEELEEEEQDKIPFKNDPSVLNFKNTSKEFNHEPREVFSLFTICAGKMGQSSGS